MLHQKSLCFGCHSGPDPESSVCALDLPAFAGMTALGIMSRSVRFTTLEPQVKDLKFPISFPSYITGLDYSILSQE